MGIFLSRTLYNINDVGSYNSICNSLEKFFRTLLLRQKKVFGHKELVPEYELYLFPFCTEDRDEHDDRIINLHIYERLKSFSNIHLYNNKIEIDQILPLFKKFNSTICTRFHAHIFSIMADIPFLSISTTKKVSNIIDEIVNVYGSETNLQSKIIKKANFDKDNIHTC